MQEPEVPEDERSAIEKILNHSWEGSLKNLIAQSAKDILCEVLKQVPFGEFGSSFLKGVFSMLEKRQ